MPSGTTNKMTRTASAAGDGTLRSLLASAPPRRGFTPGVSLRSHEDGPRDRPRVVRVPPTGTRSTRLVVLRGPSGAGKSTTARRLREHLGRQVALVEQDYLRRTVLKELDRPGGGAPDLISLVARFALDLGLDVIVEGILGSTHHAPMLERLATDHAGRTTFYRFEVSWPETVRRHRARPQAREFGVDEMRRWWHGLDPLPFVEERVIPETATVDATVSRILSEAFGNGASEGLGTGSG